MKSIYPKMAFPPQPDDSSRADDFEIIVSRHLDRWLAEQQISLAFTIPAVKLFLIGLQPDGQLSLFERTFNRSMGIAAAGNGTLYLSTRYQIWRLENVLPGGQLYEEQYDRLYIPRVAYTTGLVNTHDVAVDGDGRVLFVATRFGCIATVSERYNLVPLWHPPYLPGVLPGDRCHLNGLAIRDGRPAFATSVSRSDNLDGWRDHRRDGGVVVDLSANEVVCTGLSMPHSPRWYRDQLWLTNSGSGEFGRVDLQSGRFEPLTFAPGFLRGLTFFGDYAIVGSSRPRYGNLYSGLALDDELERRRMASRLGFFIVNLNSGAIEHWLFIQSEWRELYDVVALPGVRQPCALGFVSDEIARSIWFDHQSLATDRVPTFSYVSIPGASA